MKTIHWVSPLPPDRTDIGHFTNRTLPAFAGKARVTIWTATENPVPPDLAGVEIRRFERTPEDYAALNRADAIFYNLGNHGGFHWPIQEMAWMMPGIVILHEADLHGLFFHYWLERHDRRPIYLRELERAHGAPAIEVAHKVLTGLEPGEAMKPFPLLSPALVNAFGAVCHTQLVREEVERNELPALQVELPYEAGPLQRRAERDGPIRLVQFGYLGIHRRIDSVLDALARQPDRDRFRFDIYGPIWDEPMVRGWIAERGLQEIVTLKGFVPEAELDEALASADLVFNLRFPTIGEASGSQLRIFNAGVPSVVSDIGWFAQLPDETVLKAHPKEEARLLDSYLTALLSDRTVFDDRGFSGRRRLETVHAPEAYVDGLLGFTERLTDARRGLARQFAQHRFVGVTDSVIGWTAPLEAKGVIDRHLGRGSM
ncbi:MAG: glycosyltransferase family 4 protein [Fulvimarina manganoxydans]|uniref:hypothetical protein n=1 Tax=Fulvimarina manganoxydans TaxID=937218 RepID=UPI002353C605|nr:hypothetical protein [Fulvimarina manganoxydans]MCK5933092.1 glycosyltransferase family 4 protein [Fulvimarina manganoxydans]